MALLFADENFPAPAVNQLRQLGHDVMTMLQTDMAGLAITDEDVLAFATSANRCLLTLNRRDFIKLHTRSNAHAGILICTFDVNFQALAERIDHCLSESKVGFSGQLLRVQKPQA